MPQTIRTSWTGPSDNALPRIALRVDRDTLSKRRWRGVAEDGRDFIFDTPVPLRDGDLFLVDTEGAYFVEQLPEPVLEVECDGPEETARISWNAGQMQLPIETAGSILRLPDDSAGRNLLQKCEAQYRQVLTVLHAVQALRPTQ